MRILFAALVILIIGIVSCSAWFYLRIQKDSTGTKVFAPNTESLPQTRDGLADAATTSARQYTNSEFGFSLVSPIDLSFEKLTPTQGFNASKPHAILHIQNQIKAGTSTWNGLIYINSSWEGPMGPDDWSSATSSMLVSGVPATVRITGSQIDGKIYEEEKHVDFVRNSNSYFILLSYDTVENRAITDSILQRFAFATSQ